MTSECAVHRPFAQLTHPLDKMPKAVCVLLGTAGVTGTITFEEGPSGAPAAPPFP